MVRYPPLSGLRNVRYPASFHPGALGSAFGPEANVAGRPVADIPDSLHTRPMSAPCLWPHACFACRKSWKLAERSNAKCPECGQPLHWMGRAFKAPRKADKGQWNKVSSLWSAGYRFINHEGWREVAPYPERLTEVEAFIRDYPDHPFRVKG